MINLNDEKFSSGSGSAVFNGGAAGAVNNVTVSIEKKGAEDKPNSPEYKVIYTDASGATVNTGYWYVEGGNNYKSEDELIIQQGKALKHLVHAICGEETDLPTFSDAKGMLDGVMVMLKKAAPTAGQFRVFANYGSTYSPKEYIQVRSWVPFIEPMAVSAESTRLTPGNIDQMDRITKDEPAAVGAGASAGDDDAW